MFSFITFASGLTFKIFKCNYIANVAKVAVTQNCSDSQSYISEENSASITWCEVLGPGLLPACCIHVRGSIEAMMRYCHY